MSNEIEARRQRAREAAYDEVPPIGIRAGSADRLFRDGVEAAIETATRVKITPEIVEAAELSEDYAYVDMIVAAFKAAGFEVEK